MKSKLVALSLMIGSSVGVQAVADDTLKSDQSVLEDNKAENRKQIIEKFYNDRFAAQDVMKEFDEQIRSKFNEKDLFRAMIEKVRGKDLEYAMTTLHFDLEKSDAELRNTFTAGEIERYTAFKNKADDIRKNYQNNILPAYQTLFDSIRQVILSNLLSSTVDVSPENVGELIFMELEKIREQTNKAYDSLNDENVEFHKQYYHFFASMDELANEHKTTRDIL